MKTQAQIHGKIRELEGIVESDIDHELHPKYKNRMIGEINALKWVLE